MAKLVYPLLSTQVGTNVKTAKHEICHNKKTFQRAMDVVLLLIPALVHFNIARCSFLLGRILPSGFDFNDLNGNYTPDKAINICEENLQCAGFTYRGLLNNKLFPHRKYECFFTRFIAAPYFENSSLAPNWVTFQTEKQFLAYDGGIFPGITYGLWKMPMSLKLARQNCLQDHNCAGFIYNPLAARLESKLSVIGLEMDKLRPEASLVTYVDPLGNIENNHMMVELSERYCPKSDLMSPINVDEWVSKVEDSLHRLPCDYPLEKFENEHVNPGIPAILTGCDLDWPARNWTWESLLGKFEEEVVWVGDVLFARNSTLAQQVANRTAKDRWPYYMDNAELNGQTFLQILKELDTKVRIFEHLGVEPDIFNTSKHHKRSLLTDWSWPSAIPRGMLHPTYPINHYTWMELSQASTGSTLHTDPSMTDAWNALITGRKHWVILPQGMDENKFVCKSVCKEDEDEDADNEKEPELESWSQAWFENILPELRQKSWFGRKIIEAIQGPGETIYVPYGMAHAVLNLEDNLALTENFLPQRSIDILAKYAVFDWPQLPHQFNPSLLMGNLLNRDLNDNVNLRRYARQMMLQIENVQSPTEMPKTHY